MASAAPLRIWRPFRSTPLMRVCAVKGTNVAPELLRCRARGGRTSPWPARRCCGPPASRRPARPAGRRRPARARRRPAAGMNSRGLAVAERDGAGLVEQQHVDVAGGLHRAARHGDHVRLDHAVHAGDADGRQQRADGGRDQADEQRHQHGDRDRASPARPRRRCRARTAAAWRVASRKMMVSAASRMLSAISLGVFCRLAPSTSAIMRSRNVSPGLAVTCDDEPVGQHPGAAGDRSCGRRRSRG